MPRFFGFLTPHVSSTSERIFRFVLDCRCFNLNLVPILPFRFFIISSKRPYSATLVHFLHIKVFHRPVFIIEVQLRFDSYFFLHFLCVCVFFFSPVSQLCVYLLTCTEHGTLCVYVPHAITMSFIHPMNNLPQRLPISIPNWRMLKRWKNNGLPSVQVVGSFVNFLLLLILAPSRLIFHAEIK